MSYVKAHTPLFTNDERINILWLWCMENYHKYNPEISNLTGWILGVSRRIIDVYRKERGSRKIATVQFPDVETVHGQTQYFENFIPDHRLHPDTTEKYGNHEYIIDDQDSINYMWKMINQTIPKVDNRAILQNYGQLMRDDNLSEQLGVKKVTMQTRRTQYKRKVQDAIQKKDARRR